jgi:hypothetical protein
LLVFLNFFCDENREGKARKPHSSRERRDGKERRRKRGTRH